TRLSRNSRTSGKFSPVSTCMTGNGMRAGANALRASSSITMESLPPENSSTKPRGLPPPPHRREQPVGELRAAHQQVRQPRVRAVVDQGRTVEPDGGE